MSRCGRGEQQGILDKKESSQPLTISRSGAAGVGAKRVGRADLLVLRHISGGDWCQGALRAPSPTQLQHSVVRASGQRLMRNTFACLTQGRESIEAVQSLKTTNRLLKTAV